MCLQEKFVASASRVTSCSWLGLVLKEKRITIISYKERYASKSVRRGSLQRDEFKEPGWHRIRSYAPQLFCRKVGTWQEKFPAVDEVTSGEIAIFV